MTPSVVTLRAINIGPGHEGANYDVSKFIKLQIEYVFYEDLIDMNILMLNEQELVSNDAEMLKHSMRKWKFEFI